MLRFLFILSFLFIAAPSFAQEPDQITTQPVTEAPATEESISREITAPTTEPDLQLKDTKSREFEDAPILRLRILDKVRAESRTFELNVGRTVAYSNLRIRPRACRKSSPLDEPESAAFLQIWEVKPDDSSAWVFSGWMFASSPSLSAMDHPVYDVTVLECKMPEAKPQPADKADTTDEAAPADSENTPAAEPTDGHQDTTETEPEESTKETPESESAPSSAQ